MNLILGFFLCRENAEELASEIRVGPSVQYWSGGRMPAGAEAKMQGAVIHLLLAAVPASRTCDLFRSSNNGLWSGSQIMPGSLDCPSDAKGLVINMMSIDELHEDEFNDWYNTEHIARISRVPGVLAARRFKALDGEPKYAAVYHLASPEIAQGALWASAATTPWTARMQKFRFGNRRYLFRSA
ncbi:hypothetical protein B0G71_7949 [Paraburkholderia sp. BL27I4N3]|uniref:DUF4286 family protein n=1 Tax=Paraburkholderia sp. BL27I4N3 TaxID=1938805 RepID=UPI000E37F38D|nr:DUF4286 family protein [Paraburkholderia sp. BL27I4N3]REE07443.1 hypothetical protein B0G71_7949 [Paraburkholderia sp. BL27I4N3]